MSVLYGSLIQLCVIFLIVYETLNIYMMSEDTF